MILNIFHDFVSELLRHRLRSVIILMRISLKPLIILSYNLGLLLEYVLHKQSAPPVTTGKQHDPEAMLNTLMPCAPIDRAVSPVHLTKTLPLVLEIAAPVSVPRLPFEVTPAVFLIVKVISFILVGLSVGWERGVQRFPPFSLAMLETILESTLVGVSIHPFILSETFWLAVLILANVDVSIGEEISAVTMSETCLPLSLVPVPVEPDMHTVTLSLAGLPLPYIGFSVCAFPHSVTFLHAMYPLTIVNLTVFPLI